MKIIHLFLTSSLCLNRYIFVKIKAGFISPIVQVGRVIGFLFYGVLSVDSVSDSEKRNGEVHEEGTPERMGARDLWLHGEGG